MKIINLFNFGMPKISKKFFSKIILMFIFVFVLFLSQTFVLAQDGCAISGTRVQVLKSSNAFIDVQPSNNGYNAVVVLAYNSALSDPREILNNYLGTPRIDTNCWGTTQIIYEFPVHIRYSNEEAYIITKNNQEFSLISLAESINDPNYDPNFVSAFLLLDKLTKDVHFYHATINRPLGLTTQINEILPPSNTNVNLYNEQVHAISITDGRITYPVGNEREYAYQNLGIELGRYFVSNALGEYKRLDKAWSEKHQYDFAAFPERESVVEIIFNPRENENPAKRLVSITFLYAPGQLRLYEKKGDIDKYFGPVSRVYYADEDHVLLSQLGGNNLAEVINYFTDKESTLEVSYQSENHDFENALMVSNRNGETTIFGNNFAFQRPKEQAITLRSTPVGPFGIGGYNSAYASFDKDFNLIAYGGNQANGIQLGFIKKQDNWLANMGDFIDVATQGKAIDANIENGPGFNVNSGTDYAKLYSNNAEVIFTKNNADFLNYIRSV